MHAAERTPVASDLIVIDLIGLPAFAESGTVHFVVESPRGSVSKLKYDPDLGVMALARPLVLGLAYPCDWGFIPSTQGPDGDPIDAFIMWDGTSYPGTVVTCRPIGVLRVEQNSEEEGGRQRNDRVALLPVENAMPAPEGTRIFPT